MDRPFQKNGSPNFWPNNMIQFYDPILGRAQTTRIDASMSWLHESVCHDPTPKAPGAKAERAPRHGRKKKEGTAEGTRGLERRSADLSNPKMQRCVYRTNATGQEGGPEGIVPIDA